MDRIDVQVMRSHIARGLTLAGELLGHFERGAVFSDVFGCYVRLKDHLGLSWADVDERPTIIGWPSHPEVRIRTFLYAIAPALRNAEALDAARHWAAADAVMLAYADTECGRLMLASAHFLAEANHPGTEDHRRNWALDAIAANDRQMAIYRAVLTGKPWVQEDVTIACAFQCGKVLTAPAKHAPALPKDWICSQCEDQRDLAERDRYYDLEQRR